MELTSFYPTHLDILQVLLYPLLVFLKEVVMAKQELTDLMLGNFIILTIQPGGGIKWEKFERCFGKATCSQSQFKKVLRVLREKDHICLKKKRYRLTEKGLKKYGCLAF